MNADPDRSLDFLFAVVKKIKVLSSFFEYKKNLKTFYQKDGVI